MKKIQYLFKLSVFAMLLTLCNVNTYAGTNASMLKNKQTPVVNFFSTDTVLIILPDTFALNSIEKTDIEHAIFWEDEQHRPVFVYKSESEVNKQDFNKHMLFYGCIHQFQRTEFLSIPLKKDKKGFRFQNKRFNDPTDSFFYVNKKADRMYLCKNAENTRHQFFSMGGTAYPMHIFSHEKIVITGVM